MIYYLLVAGTNHLTKAEKDGRVCVASVEMQWEDTAVESLTQECEAAGHVLLQSGS